MRYARWNTEDYRDTFGKRFEEGKIGGEKQLALLREYRARGDRWRVAYDMLVLSLSGIVARIARPVAKKYRLDVDDLIQDGMQRGLIPAINSFDDSRRIKISTYAYIAVSRVVRSRARCYTKQRKELLGNWANQDGEDVFQLLAWTDDGSELERRESCATLRATLTKALTMLTATERRAIRSKYLGPDGQKKDQEVAVELGISRSRVTQLLNDARRKLRKDKHLQRFTA